MKNKIVYALLSLLIAFGLWAYVITVVSPESEETFHNVPIAFDEEAILRDNGLMIVSGRDSTVTVRLKGNRTDLNDLKTSDITIRADLSRIEEPGKTELSYTVEVQGNSEAYDVVDQNPKKVTLEIAQWTTKDVDIQVNYTGSVPADYVADTDSVELDHQKVTLTGPVEVLEQITQAVISVDLTNKSQTISESYRITLCDAQGKPVDAGLVQVSIAEVKLTLRILRVKEVELVLDVTYGGGATMATTQITLDPKTIKVAGSEKLLDGLDTLTVGTVNLGELGEGKVLTFAINLPEGVENITGITEVSANIQFPGLKTKTVKVTRITPIGDANTTVTLLRKDLDIIVRGTAEQIDRLTDANVQIRVDCTGAELGEGKFKVQVLFDIGFENMGAVGSYYMHATIQAKQ